MPESESKTKLKTGILLVNLGSPKAPTRKAVRHYLREFLSDPRVVNIPRVVWWVILNFFVLPFRPGKSAHAYQTIWTEQGSPLVHISQQLTELVGKKLQNKASVKLAMRYGQPAIKQALSEFKKESIQQLFVLPLYPQFSTTTTASVFDAVIDDIKQWPYLPNFDFISDYHQHPAYIKAVAGSIELFWEQQGKAEQLLFSFHGLPKNSIKLGDPYFSQCQQTAKLIAAKLGVDESDWKIVFQSRFGRAEWLKPYCIEVLKQLPQQNVKRIDIVCPGFAVDCLETLEEIAITNKAIFIAAGGVEYRYIPALNASQLQLDVVREVLLHKALE